MRISDWSSDVCSSDLSVLNFDDPITRGMARHARGRIVWFSLEGGANRGGGLAEHIGAGDMAVLREPGPAGGHIVLYKDRDRISVMAARDIPATLNGRAEFNIANALAAVAIRSEEHTSELQSLMRISYAFFRLKKK